MGVSAPGLNIEQRLKMSSVSQPVSQLSIWCITEKAHHCLLRFHWNSAHFSKRTWDLLKLYHLGDKTCLLIYLLTCERRGLTSRSTSPSIWILALPSAAISSTWSPFRDRPMDRQTFKRCSPNSVLIDLPFQLLGQDFEIHSACPFSCGQ